MAEKLGRVVRSQWEDIWVLLEGLLKRSQPATNLRGSARRMDASQGGAQAWFPQRFPQLKQVDVFMTIEGVSFRGRAEIVGSTDRGNAEVKGGLYRHNLRWVALHAQGMAALSRIAPSA